VRKPWKTIVGFALLGLTIAALCFAYSTVYDYTKPVKRVDFAVFVVSIVLCPPQLLFASCIDCEMDLTMFSIIGGLNMGLYALVGYVVASLRKPGTKPN
jgi:fucose 4-O-acetylase-like acetyltransferase